MKEITDLFITAQENAFWRYSLAVYDHPGVSSLLLMCQNELDADVNVLLCCGWLGQQNKILTATQIDGLERCIEEWREQCVRPLRSVREFLKNKSELERFRTEVKTLELAAEKYQQQTMYAYLQGLTLEFGPSDMEEKYPTKKNLVRYLDALPKYDVQQYPTLFADLLDKIQLHSH